MALAASIFAYHRLGASWLEFGLLLFAPDAFMLGYFAGSGTGARCYNVAHTYLTPGLLFAVGYFAAIPGLVPISLIWTTHIGFDRALGYGLKYETGFKDTHLRRV